MCDCAYFAFLAGRRGLIRFRGFRTPRPLTLAPEIYPRASSLRSIRSGWMSASADTPKLRIVAGMIERRVLADSICRAVLAYYVWCR